MKQSVFFEKPKTRTSVYVFGRASKAYLNIHQSTVYGRNIEVEIGVREFEDFKEVIQKAFEEFERCKNLPQEDD